VTFELDLDPEHTLNADRPGDHCVQVWSRSVHLPRRRSNAKRYHLIEFFVRIGKREAEVTNNKKTNNVLEILCSRMLNTDSRTASPRQQSFLSSDVGVL